MQTIDTLSQLQFGTLIQVFFMSIAFLFMLFSCMGWGLEVCFRRMVSAKKWINPGFLKGPYLPIYGFGVVILSLYILLVSYFEAQFPSKFVFHLTIILGIGIFMTLLELVAGLIFIEKMHIRLWDYSDRIGNYKGIICPTFSVIWTILGAIFYFVFFHRIVLLVVRFITLDWFLFAVFFMGIFYGVFVVDLMQSMEVAQKLKALAEESERVLRWEAFKQHIKTELREKQLHPKFLSPFRSPIQLREHLRTFLAAQGDREERIERIKKLKKEIDAKKLRKY